MRKIEKEMLQAIEWCARMMVALRCTFFFFFFMKSVAALGIIAAVATQP